MAYTKKDSEEFATMFNSVKTVLDLAVDHLDLEKGKAMLRDMRHHASKADALSVVTRSTKEGAVRDAEADVFKAFLLLIEARSQQRQVVNSENAAEEVRNNLRNLL